MARRRKLGELLIEAGLLDESQLEVALVEQRRYDKPLGVTLILLDLVAEEEMLRVLGRQLDVPAVRLTDRGLPPELAELLPYEFAKRHQCLPLHVEAKGAKKELYVGMSNPTDLNVLDDIAFRTSMTVHAVLVSPLQLDDAIERQYSHGGFASAEDSRTARDFELETYSQDDDD